MFVRKHKSLFQSQGLKEALYILKTLSISCFLDEVYVQ